MKKILMTGATGLVGNALGQKLFNLGYELKVVSRSQKKALQHLAFPAEIVECDLNTTELPASEFNDVQHVVHLAGESVDGRWTDQKKQDILNSRTLTTNNLLKNIPTSVKTVVSASAQGFYGDQGETEVDESSPKGSGFLSDVCQQWEQPLQNLQQRTVIVRVGVVLSQYGGALKKMLPIFQKNIGASLGSGQQWMSWIHLDDLCQIFASAIQDESYQGIYNGVSEHPVRNSEFTAKLCQNLNAIQAPKVPAVMLKIMFGEMSEIILGSTKVKPARLLQKNFKFQYNDLDLLFQQEVVDFKDGQGFFTAQQYLPYSVEKVFDFFSDAKNLEKITPDILSFKIKDMSTEQIQQGTLINYSLKIHGVPASWQTEIQSWQPPYQFVDNQLKGPYSKWHHTHTFEKMGNGTLMRDFVRFKLPLGYLGRLVAGPLVQGDVETIFAYRRQIIADEKF